MTKGQYTYFKAGLIAVYFLTRMIKLDADIPLGWGLVQYQQFDEFFYSLLKVLDRRKLMIDFLWIFRRGNGLCIEFTPGRNVHVSSSFILW